MLGDDASEHRSGQARRCEDSGEIGLVAPALARRGNIGDHGLRERDEAAAAKPLQPTRDDQD